MVRVPDSAANAELLLDCLRWMLKRGETYIDGILLYSQNHAMPPHPRYHKRMAPVIRAARGTSLRCRGWKQETALRMLLNNLDSDVAERPAGLVVYGGTGKAAREWPSFHAIVRELESLGDNETLLVQSGRPVGVFRTHAQAPRGLIANANLVGHWSNWEQFRALHHQPYTQTAYEPIMHLDGATATPKTARPVLQGRALLKC